MRIARGARATVVFWRGGRWGVRAASSICTKVSRRHIIEGVVNRLCGHGLVFCAVRVRVHAPAMRDGASQLLGNTVTYSIKEIFYPAGRRCARGPSGRVLPLFRLQSVDGPRKRPRHGRVPVLRHGFRRHRWRTGRQVQDAGRTGRADRQPVARQLSGQQIRGVCGRRTAAARCRADRRHARGGLAASPSKPTAPCPCRQAWTGSASARRWVPPWWCTRVTKSRW